LLLFLPSANVKTSVDDIKIDGAGFFKKLFFKWHTKCFYAVVHCNEPFIVHIEKFFYCEGIEMRSTVGNVGSYQGRPVHGLRRRIGIGAFVSAALLAASAQTALAGAEFKLGDDASLSLGLGLRTSYTNLENGAANGSSGSNAFSAENTRVYMSGSFGKYIKATMNFDRQNGASGTGGLQMLDGIAQFEFTEGFNIWIGRMLPPSDRANLYGPFYTSAWSYPCVVSCNGSALAAGRDDGATIWGSLFESKLAYSFGAFNGHNRAATASNASHKLLYAGRLQYSFWDAETGYYRNATYLGDKSIFTIGASINDQANGVGSVAVPGNLKVSNVDLLIEKKTAGGYVPTLEGAYYKYSLGAKDCGSIDPGSPACGSANPNVGGLVAGKGYMGTLALMFPDKIGWGYVQPFIRYQKMERDVTQTTNKGVDFGVNYLIKGFNAKISAVYSQLEDTNRPVATRKQDQFVLGVQLQY